MVVPKITNTQNSSSKTHKLSFVAQIFLRVLVIVTTIVASWLILTSKQTVVVYGITADASYKYSSAYKFFAYANLIACVFSVLSLLLVAFIIGNNKRFNQSKYFYLFLHDLLLTVLLMAGCAAATAIGYLAKYGNNHVVF
ncbi:hypothetical protein Leryth_021871 [Lithospermum erythrorhizon]|nr:hypothetical protein Leryth_021871 [Lithospermum erythrorhizon]